MSAIITSQKLPVVNGDGKIVCPECDAENSLTYAYDQEVSHDVAYEGGEFVQTGNGEVGGADGFRLFCCKCFSYFDPDVISEN